MLAGLEMCQYNYLTLPPSADAVAIGSIARSFGKKLTVVPHHVLCSLLRAGETLHSTSTGSCDCGSCVGCAANPPSVPTADLEKDMQKLEAKGWSQGKIARWRAGKMASARRDQARHRELIEDRTSEAKQWCALLDACLRDGGPEWVGLIHTWEGGGSREMRTKYREVDLKLRDLNSSAILELPQYRLLRVLRG